MPDVQEDYYNDPPPPSAIRTYRESKRQSRKVNPRHSLSPEPDPPLLLASFGSPPSSPRALANRNDRSVAASGLDQPLPTLLSPPLASPSAQSLQADSFFNRAFVGSVEPGSSVEIGISGAPSSQSHQTQVRLGPVPSVATQTKNAAKTPVVVDQLDRPAVIIGPSPLQTTSNVMSSPLPSTPQRPPVIGTTEGGWRRLSSHRRDLAQFFPEPRALSPPQLSLQMLPPIHQSPPHSLPHPPRLQRASAAYSRGVRRNSDQSYEPAQRSPAQYTPANRFVPARDKIVLPAPLALAQSSPPRSSPTSPSSPPPRYSSTNPYSRSSPPR